MAESTERKWVVGVSPHLRAPETTSRIMWQVVLALAPAGLWGVYWFGWPALWVIALSVGAAVLAEAATQFLSKRPVTVGDGSAVITGLLLAYVLPSHTQDLRLLPWYVPVTGAVVAVGLAKHCFGGLGQNVWNPALVGRAFVQVSFPTYVSLPTWPTPWADAATQATALAQTPAEPVAYGVGELFLGRVPGCVGEVSAVLLLLGGAFLVARKIVDWRLVAAYLASVVVLVAVLPAPEGTAWAGQPFFRMSAYHLFAGGLMLGAFFMATDMCTSPLTRKGQVVFGLGCGVLTALFRLYSAMPEGVAYSILLMNSATPLIDRHTRPRVLGEKRK